MDIKKQTIRIHGQTIHYRTVGTGEPVIFIHGLAGSVRWWKHNIAELAKHFQVYLIDLPGFGSMGSFIRKIPLEQIDAWVVALLKTLQINRAYFIGHSMGGYICIQIAAAHPEMVKKLILVSSVGITTGRTILTSLIPLLIALRYVAPSFLPILVYDSLRAGPMNLLLFSQDILAAQGEKELHQIHAPTLLIWGENDTLIPADYAYQFQKEIPGSQLVILERAGHVPMFDRPESFNAVVCNFLNRE